ncbi:MAG: CHC2 zinc finger domain-containing protein [Candidatus Woesearchaeota archaeon]
MIKLFPKKITIEQIETFLSQKEIIEYYIGDISKPICSPFREDKNPSLTFKVKGNKVIWKDWGTGEGGDVYSFLMLYYKKSFNEILEKIWKELILNKSYEKIYVNRKKTYKNNLKSFEIQTQSFGFFDRKYWKSYGISIKTLVKYNVYSIKYFNFNNISLEYSINNPIYGYKFSKDIWKIYTPFNRKRKFLFNGNKNIIEGYEQLDSFGSILFITKSLKDVMLFRELGYNAISFISETVLPEKEIILNLKERFNKIIVFYDNDEAGVKGADKLCSTFDLEKLLIPKEFETKDITDTFRKYGKEFVITFLKKSLNEN